ncbi:hypothetical protein JDN40_06025 [Rhodomicrobium vannielii ATCC 17100]|uniref:hypothetical protein n=1 Tax=Rhodomicrobium vannielii TaxID=1069 RepID=UPI001917E518|nr:hypothetical protein [Rhodomicrobium vannielii]MBJ7533656.1 hypothetical protein [Rhodomicrobium vannielii ATCC 17100]
MSGKTMSHEEKAEIIANYIGINFLAAAKELRELQDIKPDVFLKVAEMAGLGKRTAYALARIARQFDVLGVPEERLRAIGWAKLQIIGRYLTEENAGVLLELAEKNTVYELESRLRGEIPVEDARVIMLYLAPDQYERFKAKLIAHGAVPSGNGLLRKEKALMAIIDRK